MKNTPAKFEAGSSTLALIQESACGIHQQNIYACRSKSGTISHLCCDKLPADMRAEGSGRIDHHIKFIQYLLYILTCPCWGSQTAGYHVAYVGNIAFAVGAHELHELFKECDCKKVRLHTDRHTGQSKGFAHVHFKDEAALDK